MKLHSFTLELTPSYWERHYEIKMLMARLNGGGYDWTTVGQYFLDVNDIEDAEEAEQLEKELNDLLTEHRVMTQLEST